MAYVYDPALTDEENKKRESEQNQSLIAQGGGIVGSGGMNAGSAQQTPGQSGSYTNLQKYLTENESQSQDLAQKFGQRITEAGTQAKAAAEGLSQKTAADIEAGRARDTGIVEEAAANPTGVSSDAEKRAAFLKARDAAYGGPTGVEDEADYQDVQSKIKAAQDRFNLAKTESGRTELLKELSPEGAGHGKLVLNQLLLGAKPENLATLESAAQPFANLQDYLSAQSEDARTKAAAAATEAKDLSTKARSRVGGRIPTLQQEIDQQVAAQRQAANDRLTRQRSAVSAGSPLISNEDLMGLGVQPEDYRNSLKYNSFLKDFYGDNVDLSQLFTQTGAPDVGITPENVATPDQYAQYLALVDLMGANPDYLSPKNIGLAGTAGNDFADLNAEAIHGIPGKLTEKDQAYLDKYGATIDPDGRVSVKDYGLLGADPHPEQIVAKLSAIAKRGVGKLPPQDFPDMTDEELQRALDDIQKYGRIMPHPNPGPSQPGGGAPPETNQPQPTTPNTAPPPPPPHPQGYAYYGWMPDGKGGTIPIYSRKDQYGRDVPIYYDGTDVRAFGVFRDPQTGQISTIGAV